MGFCKSLSVFILSVWLLALSEANEFNGGFTVDLIHRENSPISPFYNPSDTHFDRLRKAFNRSFSRSLRFASLTSSKAFDAPINSGLGEYLMKINVGTPPVEQLGIADTGSDLTWIQCQPCVECFNQTPPIFEPRKTKTYKRVRCSSRQCSSLEGTSCDQTNSCLYQISYGDMSYSIGELSLETLSFGSGSDNSQASFTDVVFGCGHENVGTFRDTGSGIIGLGRGSASIINQLEGSIGGRFSYCLTFIYSNATSKISFGSNAVVGGPKVVSTPLVKKVPDTFYFLTLEGISVGTKRINYKSRSRAPVAGKGNIIIDSGTTLTLLTMDFYGGVEAAMVKAIKGSRVNDSQGMFNLCYKLPSGGQFDSPRLTAHFTGADVVLPQGSTFIEVERGVVCLTLVPADAEFGIFGNLHQMNYKIGYDLVKQVVNFLPTDCSK